ncbi:hypothetical protein [Actinoplanes sp. NPDC026623]|uniref:WD40 repeat domain-containing protein n=1 Tax=Actinoplanes sp. NPDC026623 TaxID=3155610 RepID=UPI0033C62B1C
MPYCHRDHEQLPGKPPLLLSLRGEKYNSPNITCETLRESLVPQRGIAFGREDSVLAGAGWDGAIGLWNPATRRSLGTVPAPAVTERAEAPPESGQVPYPLAFSPLGGRLAAASADGRVRLWKPSPSGGPSLDAPPRALPARRGVTNRPVAVNALAFSGDGRYPAAAAGDTVRVWDTAELPALHAAGDPLTGHTGAVNAIAFSRDNGILATTGTDQTVRLWDVASFPGGRPATRDVLSPPGPKP